MPSRVACYSGNCIEASQNLPSDGQVLMAIGGQVFWANPDGSGAVLACDRLACIAADGTLAAGGIGAEGQYIYSGTSQVPTWTGGGVTDSPACNAIACISDTGCAEVLPDPTGANQVLTFIAGADKPVWVSQNVLQIVPGISINDPTVKLGDTVTVTGTSVVTNCGGTTTYRHRVSTDGGATFTTYATTLNATYIPPAAGEYVLDVVVTCGGESQTSAGTNLSVASLVPLALATPAAGGQVGTQITLDGSGTVITNCTGTAPTYSWSLSVDGGAPQVVASTQNATHTTVANGSHVYTLTVSCLDHECVESDNATAVIISAAPVPLVDSSFTVANDKLCINVATALTNTSTVTNCVANAWNWEVSTNGGANFTTFATTEDASYTPTTTGAHQVRVTTSCDGPASDTSLTQTIEVADVAAAFTPSTLTATTGIAVALTNDSVISNCTGAAPVYSWQVSTDNGTTFSGFSSNENASYTPAADGNYQIKLIVTCPDHGCTDETAVQTIVSTTAAIPVVNAEFTTPDLTICAGDIIALTNTSTAVNCTLSTQSWTVSINGGAAVEFDTSLSPNYTPVVPGSHEITLTQLCDSGASDTQVITVEAASIIPSASTPLTAVSVGDTVTLDGGGTNISNCTGASSFLWEVSIDSGARSTIGITQSTTHVPAAAGSHEYFLTVSCADHGCSEEAATDIVTVTAAAVPVVNAAFTTPDLSVCVDDIVALTNTSTVANCIATAWDWEVSTDGGANFTTFATTIDASYTPTTAGSHQVRVTTTCDGPASDTSAVQIIEAAQVEAAFNASTTAPVVGADVTLTDTSAITNCTGAAATYSWQASTDNGANFNEFATTADATYTPAAVGDHQIKLIVGCPDHGCSDETAVQTVTAIAAPTLNAAFSLTGSPVCVDDALDTIGLVNNTVPGSTCTPDSYTWEIDDGQGGGFVTHSTAANPAAYHPTVAGTHTVRLSVTCPGGLSDSATSTFEAAQVSAAMTASVTTVDEGLPVTLTDTSTAVGCAVTSRVWSVSIDGGASTNIGTSSPLVYTPAVGEAGTHVVTLVSTCDAGCSSTTTESITVNAVAPALPCVDAVCYVSRSADNPNATRQDWSDNGFSTGTINGGSQVFPIDGPNPNSVEVAGTGQFRSSTPAVIGGGTASARVRIRNSNADAAGNNPAIITMTFDAPTCGVVSYSLGNFGAGNNPILELATNGAATSAPRSDFPANEAADVAGTNPATATRPAGESNAYGLFSFDGATTITLTVLSGDIHYGLYIADTCSDAEYEILHCPTDAQFYTKNGAGDWVLDPAITAVGEWSMGTC